ncbi:chemotaxis protein CheW [bacterium]|nr:chemotaxis protein CheW [bacterium]
MIQPGFEELVDQFILEAHERLDHVESLLLMMHEAPPPDIQEKLVEAQREIHTLKGNAGMMGLKDLQVCAHSIEDEIAQIDHTSPMIEKSLTMIDEFRRLSECIFNEKAPKAPPSSLKRAPKNTNVNIIRGQGSVRISFMALDELMDLLAEMVIFRNRLTDSICRGRHMEDSIRAWDEVEKAQESLIKTLAFIQNQVMNLRMVPLSSLFGGLRRIVHDESVRCRKEVSFVVTGGDTPMDKAILEVANEALGHIVRNAVIHGIESPLQRRRSGKSETGTILLRATALSNEVIIEIRDDGAGIDPQVLVHRATEMNLTLNNQENIFKLLFQPGFSTQTIADISAGRGLGLSVAAEAIQRLSGRIEVTSEPGRETCFLLHLPLSVSITKALIVQVDGEDYALPLSSVIEHLHFSPEKGNIVNHAGVFKWRSGVIPLIDVGSVFETSTGLRHTGYVIIIEADGRRRGLLVDELVGIQEIVVKGLDSMFGNPSGIGGSTILGDGRVVLILDPSGLCSLKPFISTEY